ncbi:MAG TPA: hypothetical protein DCS29_03715 [Candidatus Magasanikbacteria bacterium]|nr:hypothetical protein [Candidatus Magasanikbacteria bacterium]
MNRRKTITIYFSDPEPMGYPFNEGEYFDRYQDVISDITKYPIDVYFVRGKNSYEGNGVFSHGWYFDNGELKEYKNKIKADLIFNRDDKNTIPKIYDCKVINHPDFDELALDKHLTAQTFEEISPRTDLINSYEEFIGKMKEYAIGNGDRVVLKKNYLTEGRGIFIINAGEVSEHTYDDWHDVLLQEFLDATCGIHNLVQGNHDLRVEVINGEIAHSLMRMPKKGSFLANVSQGGDSFTVQVSDIPKDVVNIICHDIQPKVDKYRPLLYSADFMNTKEGFKLLELNSRPGLLFAYEATYKQWNGKIAQMLIEAVQNDK